MKLSSGTIRVYKSRYSAYVEWCATHRYYERSFDVVATYFLERSRTVSFVALGLDRCAIGHYHRVSAGDAPVDSDKFRRFFRVITKKMPRGKTPKKAATRDITRLMLETCDSTPAGGRDPREEDAVARCGDAGRGSRVRANEGWVIDSMEAISRVLEGSYNEHVPGPCHPIESSRPILCFDYPCELHRSVLYRARLRSLNGRWVVSGWHETHRAERDYFVEDITNSEELKAIQGVPNYVLQGKGKERHYAVGNMVPAPLAEAVGRQLAKTLRR